MYPEIDVMLLLSDEVNFLFLKSKKTMILILSLTPFLQKKFPCEIQSIKKKYQSISYRVFRFKCYVYNEYNKLHILQFYRLSKILDDGITNDISGA